MIFLINRLVSITGESMINAFVALAMTIWLHSVDGGMLTLAITIGVGFLFLASFIKFVRAAAPNKVTLIFEGVDLPTEMKDNLISVGPFEANQDAKK